MSPSDAFTLLGGIALAVCAAAYVATALFRINSPDEQNDDQRIDTIRDELSHLRNEGVL